MTPEERLEITQLLLAGVMTESVAVFRHYGILAEIEQQAERTERISAPDRIAQFGTTGPETLFRFHHRIAGFSDWQLALSEEGYTVTNTSCKLFAIASSRETAPPCTLFCISPLRALCGALERPYSLRTDATRWDAAVCRFTLIPSPQQQGIDQ